MKSWSYYYDDYEDILYTYRVIGTILAVSFAYRKVLSHFPNYHKALVSADRILTLLQSSYNIDKQLKQTLVSPYY